MNRQLPLLLFLIFLLSVVHTYAQQNGYEFTKFAGFELGTVTLSQVEQKYGPATLIESGDAGEYEAKICYSLDDAILYFLSGEMGGPNHTLLGFAVSVSNKTKSNNCTKFRAIKRKLSLNLSGLYLGMSKVEFEKVLATKVEWNETTGRAHYVSKRVMTQKELERLPKEVQEKTKSGIYENYFDVVVSVVGYFNSNNLVEFRVWKIESL